MTDKKRKRLIHIILGASAILVILFSLNFYLAKRLEKFLEKELTARTAKATNGFYVLEYDDLSIDILSGELSMGGIRLYPDREVFRQWEEKDSLPAKYVHAEVELIDFTGVNLIWRRNYRHLNFGTFEIKKPNVKLVHSSRNLYPEENTETETPQSQTLYEMVSPYINVLTVSKMNIDNAVFVYDVKESIGFHKTSKPSQKTDIKFNHLDIVNFHWNKGGYRVDSVDFSMQHLHTVDNGELFKRVDDTLRLTASGLSMDNEFNNYKVDDIHFQAANLAIPVENGMYTLKIGHIDLSQGNLTLDRLHYVSTYPQMQFSYKHPKHADWFDIKVGHLEMKDIDLQALFRDTTLRVREATVNDMTLQNMKNQKIVLPRRIVPMVYEGIQKAPIKIDIPIVKVNNFAVAYYELPKKGTVPGKLSITDVTGTVTGLTNIVSRPKQFIRIDAGARFMGTADFSAVWLMPVDPQHDQFLINANMKQFNLKDLNPFITPLAGARVDSGQVYDMSFSMDASSKEGTIQLRLPYRDLKIDMGKLQSGELSRNAFTSWLVNVAVRNNNPPNPDKPDSKLRVSHLTITRNPYHSTFNYLWQMLSPALAESVGIPESTQKFGKSVGKAIKGIKNFFTGNKDKKAPPNK